MKRKNIIMASLAVLLLLLVSSPAMALSWQDGAQNYTESITKEEFGGSWSFDAKNKTLTLNNISINTDWAMVLQMNNEVKTLILIGENSIITSDDIPIYYWGDKLTITGPGSLYASGNIYGISASSGHSLTIDGTTVHAVGNRDSAIRAYGGIIEITNGANVTAECVVSTRSGALMTGPNGKSIIRNGSTLNASVIQTGHDIFDKASDFYPIHNQTPLIIKDTSKMYLTSVKPFNFGDEATFQADSLNFSFPANAGNYMTCTTGSGKREHSFTVEETQLADGKYKLSVQGKKLPSNETEIPKTGDSANLILWIALMVASVTGMLLMRKKKEA